MIERRTLMGGLLPLAGTLACRDAAAQDEYPSRPIRLILGQSPGGSNDITARVLAPKLQALLGQPVLVENRAGGGNNLATEFVVRSPPDGYTLLAGTVGSLTVNPTIFGNLTYDPRKDLTPITLTVDVLNVLVVSASRPWRDVGDLVAAARASPETLTYGSSGVGTAGHLAGALFDRMAGIQTTHVPYRGGGPLLNDLVAGRVDFAFSTAPTVLPHMEAGRLRGIAVPTRRRSPLLPDLPTVAESGSLPGYEVANWYALLGPAGLPRSIVERWNAAVHTALRDRDVTRILVANGLEAVPSSPEELGRFIGEETAKWAAVIGMAGARPG